MLLFKHALAWFVKTPLASVLTKLADIHRVFNHEVPNNSVVALLEALYNPKILIREDDMKVLFKAEGSKFKTMRLQLFACNGLPGTPILLSYVG